MPESTPESTDTQAPIETRIIYTHANVMEVSRVHQRLNEWLNDGFVVVSEQISDGHLYIRLERDNAAIAEAARWAALSVEERLRENLNAWSRTVGGGE